MSRPLLRPAVGVLAVVGIELVATVLLAVVEGGRDTRIDDRHRVSRELARRLDLTDLALWSEASYCRHAATGDPFSAFGDHPSAMERLPAGSMVPAPQPSAFGWREAGAGGGR